MKKLNILTYSFTHAMTKEMKKRFSFMLRKSLHKQLKNAATEAEMPLSDLVEAGIKLVVNKNKVEIQHILEVT